MAKKTNAELQKEIRELKAELKAEDEKSTRWYDSYYTKKRDCNALEEKVDELINVGKRLKRSEQNCENLDHRLQAEQMRSKILEDFLIMDGKLPARKEPEVHEHRPERRPF